MRPELLDEIATLKETNIIALKEYKERGGHAVGAYCLYSPIELVMAAGAFPISLCGTSENPIPAAEKVLPRNLCPLIKSSFGFAATDTCPYFHFSDLVIAETTCDGKKKMYELLGEMKSLHLMQLPQIQSGELVGEYWYSELLRLKKRLETEFGVEITEDKLREAILLGNEKRRSLQELQDVCKVNPAPISGMDLLKVMHNRGFCLDQQYGIDLVDRLTAELQEEAAKGRSPFMAATPRILLTGVPVGVGSDKVVRIIEESGGSVVCFESCGGYKKMNPVAVDGDPLHAIAQWYLEIPCSCMSPNQGRFELVTHLAREFRADGVVDLTWMACHTYNIEPFNLRKYVQRETGLPFLHLETDYSESDTEQLKIRIEAFLEMVTAAKKGVTLS
jgi:benzoyl-CoA reductase/2-hydroxyglutaryl-CoA dehydratase subunit BcrC/BadD/HgdB